MSNNTTGYAYDYLGNQTGATDENGNTTTSTYDALSRLTSTVLPDGSLTESRYYDAAGNLTSLTHFNGATTTYTYDALNRLLSRATPGAAAVSFTYTLSGQRATMTDASGQTQYFYDSLDRLITKQTPAQGTLSYTYYPAGNVETIASSNAHGVSAAYTYDDVGRLQTVVDNRLAANTTTTYSYDAASNVHQAVYPNSPNNTSSTYTYDTLNRLTALSTPVSSYAYTLGPTGNRTKATEGSGRMLAWSYDGIYRLTNEAVSADPDNVNGSVGYVLDPVGNRKSATSTLSGVNSSGTFTYNSDDELMPGEGDTYDNSGNTLSTGGKTFTYDPENHLMSMNGGAVTLVYDGDGNRVAKTAGSVTTLYLVDDVNPTGLPQVMEELVNGAVQREYTYGLDRISENQYVGGVWTASFYGADGMDSVRQLTNSAGTVTDTYEYDAFGNMVNKTGPAPSTYTPNNYLYRGEQYDADLGLYYLRARYYNPVTGRFLNVDPMAGDGQRRYEYAGADPVNGMDPTGNADILDFALQLFVPPPIPWHPSWCGFGAGGALGGYLPACGGGTGGPGGPPPPCTGSNCKKDKLGIGVEVPKSLAVMNNVLDPGIDPGHTFVYLKDASSTVVSIMSFGPTGNVLWNQRLFNSGKMPGTGRYHLEDANANTWESSISPGQLTAGEQDISSFKASPPYYTQSFNCTTAAVSMAALIGVNFPNGVGPVLGAGSVANPYTLNQQMTTRYGSGQVVNMSTFPRP